MWNNIHMLLLQRCLREAQTNANSCSIPTVLAHVQCLIVQAIVHEIRDFTHIGGTPTLQLLHPVVDLRPALLPRNRTHLADMHTNRLP